MPIKLKVPYEDKDKVKSLGAWWYAQEKAWVVPDSIDDINPFCPWLPQEDGFIVKWPYVVARRNERCYDCGKERLTIALGAKNYYGAIFPNATDMLWKKITDDSLLFLEIDTLDDDFAAFLQEYYPFFKMCYASTGRAKGWMNTCMHCGALNEDKYIFSEHHGIFNGYHKEDFKGIRRDYLKLKFDYFISAGTLQGESNDWVLGFNAYGDDIQG